MAGNVELGDCYAERLEGLDIEGRNAGVFREAIGKVFPPLTSNVVGYDDVSDAGVDIVCESRHDGVINVNVSGITVSWQGNDIHESITFPLSEGRRLLLGERRRGDTRRQQRQ
jgi:hypothetical protein